MTDTAHANATSVTELDPQNAHDFRTALGRFPSGVVIIAGYDTEGQPVGMTCQSFSSASLDPALVVFLPGKNSTSFPHLAATKKLCLNVLSNDHEWLSRQFARPGTDKWKSVEWAPGLNETPRLDGANLWIEGSIQDILDVGDHHLVVVQVTALASPSHAKAPLVFHQGRYDALTEAQG